MDRLLRSEKQTEIKEEREVIEKAFQTAFDFSSNFVLFPIRHHSPACSYHILKTIEEYQPDCILVEGPKNAGELIDFAVSEETKAPFCIYLSFHDKNGKISEEKEKYRAFYPFLDYSPELVALREGRKRGIACEFIDLSYGEKLLNTQKASEKEEEEYGSDRTFLQSKYYQKLTEKLGCKSFNELWEMLFEIDGCHMATNDFVRNLYYYCWYSRENTEQEELLNQGDIIREYYMAENIKKAQEKYKKILVVTGGIHTIALTELVPAEKLPQYKLDLTKKEENPSYLMPFSYEESDSNFGYQSGMVFPFFYQKVWENILKNRKKPFEEAVLRFIMNTAGIVRKKQALSIADEMQSYYMARGLAELREKKECGVFELIDSVKASFVKGEINSYYQPALKNLYRLMTGMEMGRVDSHAGVPPVVNDFLEKCKKYKIQTNTSLKKETKLDTYNNESHREKSQFFHQMDFLNTGFCRYLKGQESNGNTGRILLRESWEYRFAPGVQVALISNSAYGGTLEEACLSLIAKEIADTHNNAQNLSKILLKANYMGLDKIYGELSEKLIEIIGSDMDFLSVADCFQNLCSVKNYSESFDGTEIPFITEILELSINRILTLLYTVIQIKKEEEDKVCDGIKFLYNYFIDSETKQQEEVFLQSLESIYIDLSANGALAGISSGILLKKERVSLEEVITKFEGYLNGTEEAKKMSAAFLKGFFKIAKDIIFIDNRLIQSLDAILRETSGDLFLNILPDLRLAFTYFMPFETDKIAKQVSQLYHVSEQTLLYERAMEQTEMELAVKIDRYCSEKITEWLSEEGGKDGRETDIK